MGGVNSFESALGRSGNTLKVSHKLISKQCLGPRISERSDHTTHDYTEYRYPSIIEPFEFRARRKVGSRFRSPLSAPSWPCCRFRSRTRAAAVFIEELDAGRSKVHHLGLARAACLGPVLPGG
jgi:hypothetical protein